MDALCGSTDLIADLVEEGSVSTWGVPIVCEVFESEFVVGNADRE